MADPRLQFKIMFTKKQQSELITSIEGRGEIPLKFVYLGRGAKRWDDLASLRKNRGINEIEGDLLQAKSGNFLNVLKGCRIINVIDLGCGNGYSVFPLFEGILKQGYKIQYIPIDISKEIIKIAVKNVTDQYPKIKIQPYSLDFELGNFSNIPFSLRTKSSVNLLLFLGSTLGNMSDRYRVLSNFRDSMGHKDFLIVGVELCNLAKINKLLAHYQNETIYTIQFTVLEYLKVDRQSGHFDVKFNNEFKQVETRFIFEKDVEFLIDTEKIRIEKDDELLLMRSVKFSDFGFVKTLSEVGFRIEEFTTNKDKSYALAMCQPTRYSYR